MGAGGVGRFSLKLREGGEVGGGGRVTAQQTRGCLGGLSFRG